ncbi:hypothetical protein GCM10009641_21100 [Mycobacterium cookii]|uniref:Uncharacterized protein n=1 Tax=Mycobacterium cookii TaxID=1775 RepID=A0A7I7KU98_9MYCO|nr:hypothetical protein [Mycobacterium cookii]MCV7328680.1 hypothetical protein [Mycobacterium cookii]BBX45299.1 hypothetical protein MCOO_13140 [Mycobacterium cookii]
MSETSLAVAEIATADERDYDIWLATLTQATERLDELQSLVIELRELCADDDVVQTRQVMDVLERHGATT